METTKTPTPTPPPSSTEAEDEEITLTDLALQVLKTADPVEKARLGDSAATRWLNGTISIPFHPNHHQTEPPPDRPARPDNVTLVPPRQMPKLGKGRSPQSRVALLHSLVHTESWAIDLSWDIIARFGQQEHMPKEFFDDFVRVAQDEGRHFSLLSARLHQLGSYYGALPAHDGLWDSAMETSHCLLTRLVVEHCVHEARGLDVVPTTISRFRDGGDEETAKLLETVIYPEEITHCAAGIRWFKYLCRRNPSRYQFEDSVPRSVEGSKSSPIMEIHPKLPQDSSMADKLVQKMEEACLNSEDAGTDADEPVIRIFHAVVRRHFRGPLKPPFNAEARKAAGFGPSWYEPLAVKEVNKSN